MTYIVQLFTGAAGSVAFGILFHMKKKHLPLAALGGFLGWLLFIICRECWGGVFFPTLAAAFGIDLYAEILARSCRSTSTSIFCNIGDSTDSRKHALLLYEKCC